MDQILDCYEGVIGITDNIIIHGEDDAEHDREGCKRTWAGTEQRSMKSRATLSSSLAVFMTSMDPIQIHQRSVPSRRCLPHRTKESFQSFLGMVTHPSPFIPQLSSHTLTLRGLLKTNVEYSWNTTYQVAFDKLKSLVCEDTTLRYFNMKKLVTI